MGTPSLFTTIVPITPWNMEVFLFTTTWHSYSEQCPLDGNPLVVHHNCANHTLKYESILVYHNLAIILRTVVAFSRVNLMGNPLLFTTIVPITPWNKKVFLFTSTWLSYSELWWHCPGLTWWAPHRCLLQLCQWHPKIWKRSCLPQLGNHTQNNVHLMGTPSLFTTIVTITPCKREVFLFTTTRQSYSEQCPLDGNPLVVYHNCANHTLK